MYSQKGRDSCLNKLQIHLAPHCCFKGGLNGTLKFVLERGKLAKYFCFFLSPKKITHIFSYFSSLGWGKGKALAISLLCILWVTHSAI